MNKYTRLAIIAGLVIVLDQITKAIILNTLPLYDSITVISGFFNITHVHNPGGAFGFLANQSPLVRQAVFIVAALIATVLVFFLYRGAPPTHPWLSAALALIFGGAIGNLIDRIRFHWVVDFLDVYIKKYHWPAFNVADSAITVGIAIFIWHLVFKKIPD
ncbi:MAG: signal peptidase II [bacterium]|nr:signal peptidase II [bacterium]